MLSELIHLRVNFEVKEYVKDGGSFPIAQGTRVGKSVPNDIKLRLGIEPVVSWIRRGGHTDALRVALNIPKRIKQTLNIRTMR